ncbi:MAG: phosphate ABC transporter substrate-binding protein PstS [Candidatus Margulisiibacteriota bacterium]
MIKKIAAAFVTAAILAGSSLAMSLNGAGATFPYPIYSKWTSEFKKQTGISINYQGIGSGGGIRQFTQGVVDFGGSDAPMTAVQMDQAGGDVLHIPTVTGAVAVTYNLPGVSSLKLDGETLASIFSGRIKRWDDQQIEDLNPGVALPSRTILVARRSDGSGTTHIFSSYLAKVSTAWASEMGAGSSLKWPVGVGGKGNAGVAGIVKTNEGSIGYVELSYAITNSLPVVALKNRAGRFVVPSVASTTKAVDGMASRIPASLIADLNNAPGAESYPIVGMTWILVHKNQKDAEKGKALVDFLSWAMKEGQTYAEGLLYAPLPKSLTARVQKAIDGIKY